MGEWAFWGVSIPVCIFGYYEVTGHWPDYSNQDDLAKLGAEAFAFVNVARFAIPLRIGLALSTTPWVRDNVVRRSGGGGAVLEKLAGRAIRWVCGSVRRSRLYRGVVSCVARRPWRTCSSSSIYQIPNTEH